ncbi:UNVERIFIED_ORG: hypothetical protein FHR35_007387 [Microbispora rosea subsp. rosea]
MRFDRREGTPGAERTVEFTVTPAQGRAAGDVAACQNRPNNQRQNTAATIYYAGVALRNKEISRVDLPDISARAANGVATMHIFAVAIGGQRT